MDLEPQQLILRYEHLRLRCPERERRLLASLAAHGQQVPIVVVAAGEPEHFVVVDGYKRVRALQRLGTDTLRAACWDLDEAEALLLGRLMRAGDGDTAFEQGLWLRELHLRFAMPLDELARRFDRSVSWASRRLALVRALPDAIQQRVLRGEILPHAAMKYLVPLARANRAACEQLTDAIAGRHFTTRQVGELVAAYRAGGAKTRALVLAEPRVVLQARASAAGSATTPASQSPVESLWHDVEVLTAVARRALKRVCEGACARLAPAEHADLAGAFRAARQEFERLARHLMKEIENAGSTAADGDPATVPTGSGDTGDCADDGARPGERAPRDPFRRGGGARAGAAGARRAAAPADPGAARVVQGQSGAGA
jgi:ParB/RepB/Spo0J family partition protein